MQAYLGPNKLRLGLRSFELGIPALSGIDVVRTAPLCLDEVLLTRKQRG